MLQNFFTIGFTSLQGNPGDMLVFKGFLRTNLFVAIVRKHAIQLALPTPSQSVMSQNRKCLYNMVHLALLFVIASRSQL